VIEKATLATLAGVRIVDFHGIVVGGREEKGLSLAHVEEIRKALQGKYAAAIRQRISKHASPPLESLSRGTNIRVFVAMPIIRGARVLGAVYLSRSPRNIMKGLFDNLQEVEIAGGIVLTITILLALLTSYAISRPIYALIAQTQRISRGEKDIQAINKPVTQEIALLSENIAHMAQTIAERSEYIRNFAMHVSHEFKTPLTSIQGAIELIEEHGGTMGHEQLRKFLSNTTKDTERLGKLVTRLLEMARADVLQPKEVVNPQYCVQGITHFRNSFSCVRGMKDGAAA
jgi:signal transduction histidine kinase